MSKATRWNVYIIGIHWLTAIVVLGMFAAGLWMTDLTYYSQWYTTAPHWHKSVGLLLAALTLLRVTIRLLTQRPARHGAYWEKRLAQVGHGVLYLLLFGLFVSGYLISTADGRGIDVFNWFTVPGAGAFVDNQEDVAGTVHFYVAWVLIGIASLHALAALKHHFVNRDATLKQMLGVNTTLKNEERQ